MGRADVTDKADAIAACDRALSVLERARALDAERQAAEQSASGDDRVPEPLHPYALSLLRMRLRPARAPGWVERDPVHVSLFGGTNSGKSTLLNVLLGRAAAGMNVTARFSQHPEAYRLATLGEAWLDDFPTRFAGYTRYRDEHPPRQDDVDLAHSGYRAALALIDPNHVCAHAPEAPATTTAVLWDVPDFSTEEARHWMGTVLDTIALADVVVLAVTDESYADERVGSLLRMVSAARGTIHVVANKVDRGSSLADDIRRKLDRHWAGDGDGIPAECFHTLPFVKGTSPELRLEELLRTEEATSIRGAIRDEAGRALTLKRTALRGTAGFLGERVDDLLAPVAEEAELSAEWRRIVDRVTREEFLERYRRDYLEGERYGEFNETLVRLMDRLEVPGVGELVKSLRDVVRIPLRALTSLVRRVVTRDDGVQPNVSPEHEVVATRFDAWIAALVSEAQQLATSGEHPRFARIAERLSDGPFVESLAAALEGAYGDYRPRIEAEVRERAAEIHDTIAERPMMLHSLRGANLAVDTAAIVLVVKSGGINWSDAILGPAVAGLRRTLFEAGMETYLTSQERKLKDSQYAALEEIVLERLRAPVDDLFVTEVGSEDLRTMRADLDTVRNAAAVVASEGASS